MKTRVMLPQPSNYHEPGEQPGAAFPRTFSGSGPCQQLDFGLLASSTGDRMLLPFRNTSVLWHAKETNMERKCPLQRVASPVLTA